MESSSSLLAILHNVTNIKKEELARHNEESQKWKQEVLEALEQESDPQQRLRLLVKDSGKWSWPYRPPHPGRSAFRPRLRVSDQHEELFTIAGLAAPNIQRYLDQVSNDASVLGKLKSWEDKLRQALDIQATKYEYAALFSSLVTERSEGILSHDQSAGSKSPDESTYEKTGRAEMYRQRKEWEEYVFTAKPIDAAKVEENLKRTFHSKEDKRALEDVRDALKAVGDELLKGQQFDEATLKWCITGLLKQDLLSDTQATTLREIAGNPTYLAEVASVLNMRLSSLQTWTWGSTALPLEMRRKLNGKYRVYMLEEITQALFLHFLGCKWAASLKEAFVNFLESPAWIKQRKMSRADEERRNYFLKRDTVDGTISTALVDKYTSDYFMAQLPDTAEGTGTGYADGDSDSEDGEGKKSPVALKQSLLHLVTTEALLEDRLSGECLVFQADFKWFGPSLSHDAIFATLEFLGIPKLWQKFFKSFLRAPLRFVHDGHDGLVRTRERGVPMSHILSDVMGESVLFCLEFAVNQATNGKVIYRLHDDFWFWGSQEEVTAAWKTLKHFATINGLELNEEKTGAARITSNKSIARQSLPKSLPEKPLTWGLLVLDPSAGRFVIDQKAVDEHIKEFRLQLKATTSIFGFVQAFNTYIQFFLTNFCRPAQCQGVQHIDNSLSTIGRVLRELFPSTNGNVAEQIRRMIVAKHKVHDIPDGFIYFPILFGGLELRNPFIVLQSMRESAFEPHARLEEAFDQDRRDYDAAKLQFDSGAPEKWSSLISKEPPTEFMSFQECTKYRRERSKPVYSAWTDLLTLIKEEAMESTPELDSMLVKLPPDSVDIVSKWSLMTPYWQAIVSLYGDDMVRTFGGLQVVSRTVLPMGLVGLWKDGKVRWEG